MVALSLEYKKNLSNKVQSKREAHGDRVSEQGPNGDVTACAGVAVVHLQEAELEIIRHVQRNAFSSEIQRLQDIQQKIICSGRELEERRIKKDKFPQRTRSVSRQQ